MGKITCELCDSAKNLVEDQDGIYLCMKHAREVNNDRVITSEAIEIPLSYIVAQ